MHNALFGPRIPDDNQEHDTDEELSSADDAHRRPRSDQGHQQQEQTQEITYPPQPLHARRPYRIQSSGDYWTTAATGFPFDIRNEENTPGEYASTSPSPPYVTPPSEPEDRREEAGGWPEGAWTRPQPRRTQDPAPLNEFSAFREHRQTGFAAVEREQFQTQPSLDPSSAIPPGLSPSAPIDLSEDQFYTRNRIREDADVLYNPKTSSPATRGIGVGERPRGGMDDDADSSSDAMMRKRPRGRRRRVKSSTSSLTTTTTTTKPRFSITSPLTANPTSAQQPLVYTHDVDTQRETDQAQRVSRLVALPLRPGRVPNTRMSQRTRRWILVARVFSTVVLSAWAAYSTARYWLAYSGAFASSISE